MAAIDAEPDDERPVVAGLAGVTAHTASELKKRVAANDVSGADIFYAFCVKIKCLPSRSGFR